MTNVHCKECGTTHAVGPCPTLPPLPIYYDDSATKWTTERYQQAIMDLQVKLGTAERELAQARAALEECISAIEQEFYAMGDDWKDQPIMHEKNKVLKRARRALRSESK